VAIFTAFSSEPTGLLEEKSLLSCDSVANDSDTGEGLLVMVKMCDNQVYVVMAVVLVAVVVAALVEASVVESRLVAAVDEFRDASQSMGSLSAAVM